MTVTTKLGLVPIATPTSKVPPKEASRLSSLQAKARKK